MSIEGNKLLVTKCEFSSKLLVKAVLSCGGPKSPSKIAFLEETIGSRLALENGCKLFCEHANGFERHP